jgi:hypothetical protein
MHLQIVFGERPCLGVPVLLASGTLVWSTHNPHDHGGVAGDLSTLCPYYPRPTSKVLPWLSCYDRQCRYVAAVFLSSPLAPLRFPASPNFLIFHHSMTGATNHSPEHYGYTLACKKLKGVTMFGHPLQAQVFPFHRPDLPSAQPGFPLVQPEFPLVQLRILLLRL